MIAEAIWIATGIAAFVFFVLLIVMMIKGDRSAPSGVASGEELVRTREILVDESAATIRNVLLQMAEMVRSVDSAADQSITNLSETRQIVGGLMVDPDLADAQATLVEALDHVIHSNHDLRSKIEKARKAIVWQRSQMEKLERAARYDGLTSIANRPHFDEQLMRSLSQFEREGTIFSLLMVDADHFKNVNDTHGHQAGDRVLMGLGKKLVASVRSNDFVARYGGEEFACILQGADEERAVSVAEKIREGVESSVFTMDSLHLTITISLGVAMVVPGDTAASLIQRADDALYMAKERGRNCAVLADGTEAAGTESAES